MSLHDESLSGLQLAARARRVEDVIYQDGWRDIVAELERDAATLRSKILKGDEDYVTYRQYCAQLQMVEKLLTLPSRLIAQAPKEGSPDV